MKTFKKIFYRVRMGWTVGLVRITHSQLNGESHTYLYHGNLTLKQIFFSCTTFKIEHIFCSYNPTATSVCNKKINKDLLSFYFFMSIYF